MKEHVAQITMLLKRLFDHLQLEKKGKEKVYISLWKFLMYDSYDIPYHLKLI